MNKKTSIFKKFQITSFHLISIGSVILVLIIWFVLTEFKLVKPIFLPSPYSVFNRFIEEKTNIAKGIGLTFYRLSLGYLLGCVIGVIVAILMHVSFVIRGLLDKTIPFFKSIPPLAIVPFIILWFGLKPMGVWVLVAWGCFFILVIETSEGIKNIPKIYLWAASSLGTTQFGKYFRVILPAVLPGIVGGLRISAYLALGLALLQEFQLGYGGLGLIIVNGYRFLHIDLLFMGIIVTVIIAIIIDVILINVSRYINRWVY